MASPASTPSTDTVSSDPPCRVLVRTKTNVQIFTVSERSTDKNPDRSSPSILLNGATNFMHTTPDGTSAFSHLKDVGVVRCDLTSVGGEKRASREAFLEDSSNVQMLAISPLGTYLLTWERWYQEKPNNLKLWDAKTGKLLASFPQKAIKLEAWPYLQWTHDEKYAMLLATSEVRVYPAQAFREENVRFTDKLCIPGISSHSVPRTSSSSDGKYLFTSFAPGSKDKPARGSLHEYRPGMSVVGANNNTFPAKLSKSLFQAEEMKVHWSPVGDVALATLQTSVDSSGESYYGSSQLFLFAKDDVKAVPLKDKYSAPVLAVSWMPHPDKPPCFCVVAGKMPAMASLHHGQTGEPLFWFGNAHRNTIAWAPHGRFLTLAGFGNLQGGMGFWDRNKMKLIPSCAANAAGQLRADSVVGYQWSPDSRLFLVSTTAPRMNVDNGMRLFRYSGEELQNVPWNNEKYRPNHLLEAIFVSAKLDSYPDRPQTPVRGEQQQSDGGTKTPSAPTPVPQPKPTGRYVPPSARNRAGGGTSLAERMRKEQQGNLQGATVANKQQPVRTTTGRVVVGMAAESTAKSKSALKREKAKLKKQQQEAEAAKEREQQAEQQQSHQVDPEKRARKLRKTLKQIEDLKQKDSGSLNEDQKAKVESEAGLRAELDALGL